MTIALVCAALKTICSGVTAVTSDSVTLTVKAFDPPPASLDGVRLPAVYTFTGGAEYDLDTYGSGIVAITREYELHCAVLAEGNANPEIREKHCRPLIEALVNRLLMYPNLGTAQVQMQIVTADGGIQTLPEYGGLYIGFIITLSTLELSDRTYAAGE